MVEKVKTKKATGFLKISCPRCGYRKIIYGKSTTKIKCINCNKLLNECRGGKTRIKAPIRDILK